MRSANALLDALEAELRIRFADFPFRKPGENGMPLTADGQEVYCEPHYFHQEIPARYKDPESGEEVNADVPYIILKVMSDDYPENRPGVRVTKIGIAFTLFTASLDPKKGSQDVVNLAERVAFMLLEKTFWVDAVKDAEGYFTREMPVKTFYGLGKSSDLYDSRWQLMGPYNGGAIVTQFTSAAPLALPPDNFYD